MYSRLISAHKKINRGASKHLGELVDDQIFPSFHQIMKFEGKNGPDGVKQKSPGKDEPWHYYDPFDEDDSQLLEILNEHLVSLTKELKRGNSVRASFEAAWLSHALVDGLTPAHHYPYEEKILELRNGETLEDRNTKLKKITASGETKRQTFANNWKLWGPKGVQMTHMMFEGGAAVIMKPMSVKFGLPTSYDIKLLHHVGFEELFKRYAREVALLKMYERFYARGWTNKLAREVRDELAPRMIKVVTLGWYQALIDAGFESKVVLPEQEA
jgi:hypothetical protein